MRKSKKLIVFSTILLALGILFALIGIGLGGAINSITYSSGGIRINTMKALSGHNPSYVEETIALDEFHSIDMDLLFCDFTLQEGERFEVSYKMDNRYALDYEVENDILKLTQTNPDGGFTLLSFDFLPNSLESKIVLTVPKGTQLDTLTARLDSVGAELTGITTNATNLSLSFGNLNVTNSDLGAAVLDMDSVNINVANVTCSSLSIENDFGNLTGKELSVEKEASIEIESGNIELGTVAFGSLYCSTSFGEIDFTELTAPKIEFDLDSVNLVVQELTSRQIDIDNNFGKVELGFVEDISDYSYDVETEFGDVTIDGRDVGTHYMQPGNTGNAPYIKIRCDSCDVAIQ